MRIKNLKLAWFRGAAEEIALDSDCKSVVVYGENGSGKSSFVDAVEYVLHNGKIGHLTHEYSGKNQEKGILNTHTPVGKTTCFRIQFKDGSELKTDFKANGSGTISGADAIGIGAWDYQRIVLRQDEVANFIHGTKGAKYSALLPLLGLYSFEVAAQNLRKLSQCIEQQSKVAETRIRLQIINAQREEEFIKATDAQILNILENLHHKHCPERKETTDPAARCKELANSLKERLSRLSSEQKRHIAIANIAAIALKDHIISVRAANQKLANSKEPLITEKLEVLRAARVFAEKLGTADKVDCPACGRSIASDAFTAHLKSEKDRLLEIIGAFDVLKGALGILCDDIRALKTGFEKPEIKVWRDSFTENNSDKLFYIENLNLEILRRDCPESVLGKLEANLLPLIESARLESKNIPPEAQELAREAKTTDVCAQVLESANLKGAISRVDVLISFLTSLEADTRQEIKSRSKAVIEEITTTVQSIWSILHPGEPIEDVRLHIAEDSDKAIDIALKFHGIAQDSPRLTLSEGYRNSLGLCIFLAMAKREAMEDRPLFLDDVVVSFDRNHRGMIVEVLRKDFGNRQVVILTHDREWYTELRQQLDGANWNFKALMPYETPSVGIRWSAKTSTFDDAKAFLKDAPDSAGNTARKIMDIELAVRAERLKVRLPYLHREKNDHRTAHEFLAQIISDGKKCFKIKKGNDLELYIDAIKAFEDADRLLISWGNKASHSLDLVRPEAVALITACEKSVEFFECHACKKPVYKLHDDKNEFVQCECGNLRWSYGKA